MGWSITTYVGNDIYLTGNGARIGMHQLMNAINEREWAINITETLWMMPDGTTEAARPTLTDLVGAEVKTSSTIKTNCTRIRSAIISLIGTGKFVNAADSDTAWTLITLQTAIGSTYGTSIGPLDAAFLQRSLDILDRMIYVRHEVNLTGGAATRYYNSTFVLYPNSGGVDPDGWNAAWAAMTSESVTLPSSVRFPTGAPGPSWTSIIAGRGQGLTMSSPYSQFSTSMVTDGIVSADLTDLQGVVTSAKLDCHISAYFSGGTPIDFDFEGVTLTQAAASFTGTKLITSAVPFFDTNYDFSVSVVSNGDPQPDDLRGYLQATSVIVYGDLTTVLTDQA